MRMPPIAVTMRLTPEASRAKTPTAPRSRHIGSDYGLGIAMRPWRDLAAESPLPETMVRHCVTESSIQGKES
jgi:hypothetical protein